MKNVIIAILIVIASLSQAKALEIYTFSADYAVFGKLLSTESGGVITYTPSINVRNNKTKTSVQAWSTGQIISIPIDINGLTDGVKSWKGTPTTDIKVAYTTMFNEAWKVAQYIQQTNNKLVAIYIGSTVLVNKSTGINAFELTTIPTSTW